MKSESVTCARIATCIALVTCAAASIPRNDSTTTVHLTVANEGGNKSSPLLYGVMFEVRSKSSFCAINNRVANDLFQGNGPFWYENPGLLNMSITNLLQVMVESTDNYYKTMGSKELVLD